MSAHVVALGPPEQDVLGQSVPDPLIQRSVADVTDQHPTTRVGHRLRAQGPQGDSVPGAGGVGTSGQGGHRFHQLAAQQAGANLCFLRVQLSHECVRRADDHRCAPWTKENTDGFDLLQVPGAGAALPGLVRQEGDYQVEVGHPFFQFGAGLHVQVELGHPRQQQATTDQPGQIGAPLGGQHDAVGGVVERGHDVAEQVPAQGVWIGDGEGAVVAGMPKGIGDPHDESAQLGGERAGLQAGETEPVPVGHEVFVGAAGGVGGLDQFFGQGCQVNGERRVFLQFSKKELVFGIHALHTGQ